MTQPLEDLVKNHGYSPEQAAKILEITEQDKNIIKPLNERCFILAQQYFESASALENHINQSGNANVAPGLVLCKSISLELFFKTLMIISRDDIHDLSQFTKEEKKKYFEHEIPEIYDHILAPYKDKLITIYSARMGVTKLKPEEFRKNLVEKARDIFVKWRYIHEKSDKTLEHLDLNLVNNLITATELTIVEIKNNI